MGPQSSMNNQPEHLAEITKLAKLLSQTSGSQTYKFKRYNKNYKQCMKEASELYNQGKTSSDFEAEYFADANQTDVVYKISHVLLNTDINDKHEVWMAYWNIRKLFIDE